jgi:endonuclease-8
MASDPSLVYQTGREYGTRHMVFRRTNLPCLRCGEKIRQLRQRTKQVKDGGRAHADRLLLREVSGS